MNVVQPSTIAFKQERNRGFLIKLAVVASLGCSTSPRAVPTGRTKPAENQVFFEGVRVDRFEKDHLRHRARIRTARLDRDSGQVLGETIEAEVLDQDTVVEARVTAPRMVSDLRSRQVQLEGGVEIRDRAGRTLRTETLQYDSSADRLETSAPVEIEGDNFHATGGRLTGQPRKGELEVEGAASATISDPGRGAR